MQRAALRKCRRLLGARARALIERAALGGRSGVPMKAGKGVSVSLCAAQLSWRSHCRRRDDKTPLGCRRNGMSDVETAALVYGARAVGYGVAVAVDVAVDVAFAVVVAVAVERGRLTLSRPSNLKERGEDPGRGIYCQTRYMGSYIRRPKSLTLPDCPSRSALCKYLPTAASRTCADSGIAHACRERA